MPNEIIWGHSRWITTKKKGGAEEEEASEKHNVWRPIRMCVHLADACVCAYRIKCFYPLCAITDFMCNRPKNRLTLTPHLHTHHKLNSLGLWCCDLFYFLQPSALKVLDVAQSGEWNWWQFYAYMAYDSMHGTSYTTKKGCNLEKCIYILLSPSLCISCHSRLFSMACYATLCVCNGVCACVCVCVLNAYFYGANT